MPSWLEVGVEGREERVGQGGCLLAQSSLGFKCES